MKTFALFNRGFTISILFLGSMLTCGASLAEMSQTDQLSSNVFNFQRKLAENGNAQSQTKVGEMLEAGNGVDKDLKKARHWYELAAKSGYKPAKDRLTFMDIKANGYDQAKDGKWLKSIKTRAAGQDRNSMLLLAQMYRQGIGVKKDFGAAKQLLNILSVAGDMIIDFENKQLNADIKAEQEHQQALQAQRAAQAAQRAAEAKQRAEIERQKKIQADAQAKEAAAKAKAKAASKEETEAEKRKRYEAVMKQLKEKQQRLEQEQKWAEGQKK
jgi:hypothetical protein